MVGRIARCVWRRNFSSGVEPTAGLDPKQIAPIARIAPIGARRPPQSRAPQTRLSTPRSIAAVFRIRSSTAAMATRGTMLAPIRMGANE
jgi:hypothetical protein